MPVSLRLAVFALLASLQVAWAKAGSADDLVGEVRDTSAAVIAKAQVAATNVSTGVAVTTETTSGGVYLFRTLRPGTYRVMAEAPGFRTAIAESFTLLTGQTARLDFKPEVGSTEEAIECATLLLSIWELSFDVMCRVSPSSPGTSSSSPGHHHSPSFDVLRSSRRGLPRGL